MFQISRPSLIDLSLRATSPRRASGWVLLHNRAASRWRQSGRFWQQNLMMSLFRRAKLWSSKNGNSGVAGGDASDASDELRENSELRREFKLMRLRMSMMTEDDGRSLDELTSLSRNQERRTCFWFPRPPALGSVLSVLAQEEKLLTLDRCGAISTSKNPEAWISASVSCGSFDWPTTGCVAEFRRRPGFRRLRDFSIRRSRMRRNSAILARAASRLLGRST